MNSLGYLGGGRGVSSKASSSIQARVLGEGVLREEKGGASMDEGSDWCEACDLGVEIQLYGCSQSSSVYCSWDIQDSCLLACGQTNGVLHVDQEQVSKFTLFIFFVYLTSQVCYVVISLSV